jgi:hypothetical protein
MFGFMASDLLREDFMKLSKVVFVLAFATMLAGTAWSQSANPGSSPEILGYLNPGNNSFRPMFMQSIGNPAVVTTVTGKIVTNFTITVASVLPSTTPIECNVTATVSDMSTSPPFTLANEILEQASVIATRNGATAAKCTVTIPYSWNLANKSTDKVNLAYSIFAASTSTAAGTLANRTSSQFIAVIPIPATGATTTETVKATI